MASLAGCEYSLPLTGSHDAFQVRTASAAGSAAAAEYLQAFPRASYLHCCDAAKCSAALVNGDD